MVCSLVQEGECGTAKSRIRIHRDEEFGNNLISVCIQCEEPYCVESCTLEALSRDNNTGIVTVDSELCTGCEICIDACPMGVIYLDKEKGIVFKCDLCGGDPECVKICSRDAILLEDIDPTSPQRKSLLEETAELLRQM
jgi:Fe-S-cluster-containing dehydrogenase component